MSESRDDQGGSRKPSLGAYVELEGERIHWDLGDSLSYGEYLHLDKLLGAQQPLSGQHDEMLFIVMHQASELWMKLCVHELQAAMAQIRGDDLGPAFKMLARVSRVQQQLAQSWDVLSTMTPADYSAFRDSLGKSSGFQSFQYRTLEYLIGNKNAAMIEVHRRTPVIYSQLHAALHSPSLYDEALRLLGRRGFPISAAVLERDWSQPYAEHPDVTAAWLAVYRNIDEHWDLYESAEGLLVAAPTFDPVGEHDHSRARAKGGHPRAQALAEGFEEVKRAHEFVHGRRLAAWNDEPVNPVELTRAPDAGCRGPHRAQRREVLAHVALNGQHPNDGRVAARRRWRHQPRSASRWGCGISSTLIPTIASPRPRDTLAMTSGSSKKVVALTIAAARSAGLPDLKIPLPTNTPSAPNCIIIAASAGVAMPPAVKRTTGSFPACATSLTSSYGACSSFAATKSSSSGKFCRRRISRRI